VVRDDEQIRKYGDLVRNEGRRLTEMVEQILEFAGIQSGQRGFALRPVAIAPLLWRLDHYDIQMPKQTAPLMKYAERLFSRPAFIESLTPSEKVMRK